MRLSVILGLTVLIGGPVQADDPVMPIFDAHMHYKEPAWARFPVKTVIEMMDKNGVAMALVSSTPDKGTIDLWEYAPNRIVPELRPYHGDVGSGNWTKAEGMTEYLQARLEAHNHEGIGEFHIHELDVSDAPLFRVIIDMAKERDIYLHVHSGAAEINWLYSLDPDAKIIWAHTGLGETAEVIYQTMKANPTLMADTSLKEFAIGGFGDSLNPEWEPILIDFQDRLMVGSDTYVNRQWEGYDNIIDMNRKWLSLLPRDVAEKIAYKNAARIFKRDITSELIGTR